MTHLTNDAIRKTLRIRELGDEKLDTLKFGDISEYVTA